jgi:hypothetical protein
MFIDSAYSISVTAGLYASAGRVQIHNCLFQHNNASYGFSKCVNITSGAAVGIVYGNDYRDYSSPVSNLATSQAFSVFGSVGIGTPTPGCILDINVPNSGTPTMLALSNSGGGYADVAQLDYNATSSPYPLTLNLKHSRPFVISGGSVGIGTSGPNSLLDATGPADDSEANFKTSSTYSQLVLHDSDTSTAGLKLGYRFQNGVAEYGRIQTFDSVGPTPLAINPNGGNVGIGTTSPATNALLELSSTSKALLLTRLTTTQRDAMTAVNGMIIYNTTTNTFQGRANGAWVNL